MISAIVAVDNNWGIGYNGNLLLSIPEDLKRFKKLTTGYTVIMGTNTWNSLPIKPLIDRVNIIISNSDRIIMNKNTLRLHMEDVLNYLNYSNDNIFIIGGGSIYKQLLPYCDRVYVTKIYKEFENVDTFFPNLDETNNWLSVPTGELQEHNGIMYQYWIYDRIS